MRLDIPTLAVTQSMIMIVQAVALLLQYLVNKTYRGIGWWLSGSALLALGCLFTPLVTVKSLLMLARIANPLLVLGHIMLYIGIIRFFDRKESHRFLIPFYTVFLLTYYYFMYGNNDISGRTVVVSTAIAVIELMTAYVLLSIKERHVSTSAHFTGALFLIGGFFLAARAGYTLIMPSVHSYAEFVQIPIHFLAYIIPILTTTLWTFGFIMMVNQRLYAENLEEKEQMQMIFNTSPDAASITRLSDGIFLDVNAGFLRMSECSRSEVIGKSTFDDNVWYNITDRDIYVAEMKKKGFCENMEFTFRHKDGSPFTGLLSGSIISINDQPHVYSVVRDITERKSIEAALQESEETYRSILKASPDDITIIDLEGNILMVSQAAKKMFGYADDFDRFTEMKFSEFIVPEDLERAIGNIRLMFTGGYVKPSEYRGLRKDGSIFDIEVNSGLVLGANGQPTKIIIIARDISARKQTEQQVQNLLHQLEIEKNTAQLNSLTDSLTGLSNRRYFDDALNVEFYRLKRSGSPLSMIMLDVDHFKKFNDRYGHLAGDDCLRQLGSKLKSLVSRAPDIVARYGGEEFVVILPETENQGAEALAERIRKEVENLGIPHVDSDAADCITVSLGVVTVHFTEFESPEHVVALADEAMYRAKREGRNRIAVIASPPVLRIAD